MATAAANHYVVYKVTFDSGFMDELLPFCPSPGDFIFSFVDDACQLLFDTYFIKRTDRGSPNFSLKIIVVDDFLVHNGNMRIQYRTEIVRRTFMELNNHHSVNGAFLGRESACHAESYGAYTTTG